LKHIQSVPDGALVVTKELAPLKELITSLSQVLPDGELLYDPDFYTDSSPEDLLPDMIRMEAFIRLKQEIPHSLYVRVEDVEKDVDLVKILAYVVVETDSQKRIVIGKKG
jgi:GTP-binding protein Era